MYWDGRSGMRIQRQDYQRLPKKKYFSFLTHGYVSSCTTLSSVSSLIPSLTQPPVSVFVGLYRSLNTYPPSFLILHLFSELPLVSFQGLIPAVWQHNVVTSGSLNISSLNWGGECFKWNLHASLRSCCLGWNKDGRGGFSFKLFFLVISSRILSRALLR